MLSKESKVYFDELEKTFGTPGWAILVDEATKKIYQYQADALDKTKSWDEVMFLRGMAFQLQSMIDMQEIMEMSRKLAEEEDASV